MVWSSYLVYLVYYVAITSVVYGVTTKSVVYGVVITYVVYSVATLSVVCVVYYHQRWVHYCLVHVPQVYQLRIFEQHLRVTMQHL